MPRYKIESTGNGAFYAISRLSDGASVCLQGDDALVFERMLNSTTNEYTDDDAAAEYDEVMKTREEWDSLCWC